MKILARIRPSAGNLIYWLTGLYILLRIIYLVQYHDSDLWGSLTVDAEFHYLWAKSIASGELIGSDIFFRAPLYPYFVGLLYYIFSGSILGMVIVQNIIGILSYLLVYRLAKEIFDQRSALITALLYIFTFDFVFFESELLLDFMLVFFLPLIFLIIFRAERQDKVFCWLTAGLVLGLAAATRPTVLILVIILPLYFLQTGSKLFDFRKWLIRSVFLIAGLTVILLPIAIRNAAVAGQFTALPTQGGINFYIGNNSQATGWSAAMPAPLGAFWQYSDCKRIAEQDTGEALGPSEVSRYWYLRGLEFILGSPGQAAELYLKKMHLLIHSRDISNNRNIPQFRQDISFSQIFVVTWWLILPLGIVGMIAGLRNNYKAGLMFTFIIFYSIVIILFFVTSRFRLPILPLWLIFAGFGLSYLIGLFKSRNFKKLSIFIPLMVFVAILSAVNYYDIRFSNPQQELYIEGNRLMAKGQYRIARYRYHELLNLNPSYPQANMNLAATFVYEGNLDSARHYYRRELEVNPDSALTLSSLADIARLGGNNEIAYRLAHTAINMKPSFIEPVINYAKAARAANLQAEALELLNQYERYHKANPYYYFHRGILQIDLGRIDRSMLELAYSDFRKAIEYLEEQQQPTYERDPGLTAKLFSPAKRASLMAQSYANMGVIDLNRGNNEASRGNFKKALEYDSGLEEALRGLLEANMRSGNYDESLRILDDVIADADSSDLPVYMLYKAQSLYNLGELEKAVGVLEEILTSYPDYTPAERILDGIKKGG